MAAGSTYTPLATYTVSGTSTTEIQFSSISAGYTDIVIIGNLGADQGYPSARFNSDTGSNYSVTNLWGNGSSAASNRATNRAVADISYEVYTTTTGVNTNYICHVMNYSNTSVYKTMLSRVNSASYGTSATAVLWRSTAAINNIKLQSSSGNGAALGTFLAGSTFTLYGIAAA
jgi:hypothetical protein